MLWSNKGLAMLYVVVTSLLITIIMLSVAQPSL